MDNKRVTKKWHVYKGHEKWDFEPDRAILLRVFAEDTGHSLDDVMEYLDERNKSLGDGYCWQERVLVEY